MDNVPELHINIENEEWNAIELRPQIERRKSSVVISEVEDDLNFNQLTKDELEDYFELVDIQEQLRSINAEVKHRKGLYNLISLILPCKIPKIKSSLILERDRIFAIALTEFDENEHMHFRLLITIYEILAQKRGHFHNEIKQLQESIRMQSYMFTSSSNNLEMPTGRKSFRRFKHVRSFKVRNSLGNQSMKITENSLNVSNDKDRRIENDEKFLINEDRQMNDESHETHSNQSHHKSMPNSFLNTSTYESNRRNKSFDLSALASGNQILEAISTSHALDSQYKYRLNDEDVSDQQMLSTSNRQDSLNLPTNTNDSLDSFQASLNSNFEYLSAAGFSNHHLNGTINQYNSTGHLSINTGNQIVSFGNRSFRRNRNRLSRHSLRSTDHSWSGSRKSSVASYSTLYNERVSMTIFHRTIRYGEHWQQIGFQGNDPVTDLRDLGLLSLFQLCFFVLNFEKIALQIYKLSLDEEQNFPFALTGINISQISLQTLRQGHLNRILNSRNEVFNTFNLFYSSLFLKFYQLWIGGKMTIKNSNEVLQELRLLAATKPKQLMERLLNFESNQENDRQRKTSNQNDEIVEFTDISKIVVTDL